MGQANAQTEMPKALRKILLYGDVNLNVMDGSAVWLVSMAEVLSKTNSFVDVLLKVPVEDDRLVRKLATNERIRFLPPVLKSGASGSLTPRFAAQQMLGLHLKHDYDVIVARGFQVCQFVAGSEKLSKRAWLYVTDLPFPASSLTESKKTALTKIAVNSKRMFAQTEDARSYLERVIPEAAGKTVLLPPMVPDEFFANPIIPLPADTSLKLVYAGKFAKSWRTLEMCDLQSALRERGVASEVTLIGDKFQDDLRDPAWPERMKSAISGPGVKWLGGLPREDAMHVVRENHLGLGWRDDSLNSSLEVSTKALEYAAAGVCPVINRTAAHERLFGRNYPFFIDTDDLSGAVEAIVAGFHRLQELRGSVREAAAYYSMRQAAERIEKEFRRSGEESVLPDRAFLRPLRVVLAGHDFKFAAELVDLLDSDDNIDLRIDAWTTLHSHNESESLALSEWADVVICEWAGPNAVWYSRHKREGQALIVRLHAFELRGPWLNSINTKALDAVVCVSDLYRDLIRAKTDWPASKVFVIPNAVNIADFDRPKSAGYEFRLGLVGMVPFLKRPDRALGLLEGLLKEDTRYTLHIRGRMPWEYPYEWKNPLQRQGYLDFFGRINSSRLLSSHVVFEQFGADMASWFSKIGYVLSPSSQESFHLAPAEGMASGAVPVFWDRPGVSQIFGDEFIVTDTAHAVSRITSLASDSSLYEQVSQASLAKAADFDILSVKSLWSDVITHAIKSLDT